MPQVSSTCIASLIWKILTRIISFPIWCIRRYTFIFFIVNDRPAELNIFCDSLIDRTPRLGHHSNGRYRRLSRSATQLFRTTSTLTHTSSFPVGWRWIFILEGIATILLGVMAAFVMPASIQSAKFLTTEEKRFARTFAPYVLLSTTWTLMFYLNPNREYGNSEYMAQYIASECQTEQRTALHSQNLHNVSQRQKKKTKMLKKSVRRCTILVRLMTVI